MSAAKMAFPCPMCVQKPERYVEIGGCTTKGCAKVANVIQHLILYHLSSCRICGKDLITPNDKSSSRCKPKLEAHKATNCLPRERPATPDTKQPEILTEAQEEVVLSWTRKTGLDRCDRADLSTEEKQEEAIYGILYAKLHNQPLPEGAISASYWTPTHQVKRKMEDLQREVEALREEVRARDQAPKSLRDMSLSHVDSKWDTDIPRPSHLDSDLPGDMVRYPFVDPQNLMKGSAKDAHTRKRDEFFMVQLEVQLEQTLAPSFFVPPDLSDSAYSSNGPDR